MFLYVNLIILNRLEHVISSVSALNSSVLGVVCQKLDERM